MMGHPGQYNTLQMVKEHYWWPGMNTFIKNFVDGCATCQQTKINTHPTSLPLMPIPGPKDGRPFSQISMDFIMDLPKIDGYDSLMVIVDHSLTKGVILCPCTKTIDALRTENALLDTVYKRFGLLDSII